MSKRKIVINLLLIILLTACSNKETKEVLNVLNWSSYIPNDIIESFEEEYNIKVNYGTYSSNEELLAKISSSKEGTYDLIFPSDYMVELMINRNLIKEIDKTKLTNLSNINPIFLNQEFDKDNKYSLPFLLATTVIAVNRENIKDNISSYNDLLNNNYTADIVLLDDQRITIGMSLLALGYSMNEIDKIKLEEAKSWLLSLKNNIKAYDSDSPKTFLITKETNIGVMWNAEAELAQKKNPNIEIIYCNDGHALSMDNYAILKGSKNEDNAYLFIDYLMRDDISKKIIEEYPYISPNYNVEKRNTYELISIINEGTYVKNIGSDISTYDKIWADIK